jgi:hypothetical protein
MRIVVVLLFLETSAQLRLPSFATSERHHQNASWTPGGGITCVPNTTPVKTGFI